MRSDLLAGLPDAVVDGVTALGSETSLSKGQVLFGLGDAAESLYLVKSGCIALALPMKVRGAERDVLIEEAAAGQAFGWSALVPPHRFTLKATAEMDSTVLALPRQALLDHFESRPDVGYAVTRNVASVVGHRLQVLQAMWLREMQRVVELSHA